MIFFGADSLPGPRLGVPGVLAKDRFALLHDCHVTMDAAESVIAKFEKK
jgi:hypothetical protein